MINLHNKKIAVVGVSEREHKYGYKIFRDLIKHDFQVEGVNPRGGELFGKKIYKDLKSLERVPDMVITVVAPKITERIIGECIAMGVGEIWMQPGSESEAAIENAKLHGVKVTYNSCFMLQQGIW